MRLLTALIVGLSASAPIAVAEPAKPNIVVLLADDLGSADVGFNGGTLYRTPNLDRLAAAGAVLRQFYVQPVCSPTRAALLTGRYPMRHGLQVGVVRPWAQYGLPLEERTLAQALKECGYRTAITGKWHLGHFRPEYLPTRRGFDHQYGHYNGAIDYNTHVRDGGFDWHRDDKVCRDEGYATHLLAREAVRLIKERDKAAPLFLYVPFNGVHTPHQVPEKYKEPFAGMPEPRRTYAAMIAALDEACGQIVAAVEAEGIRGNTVFFFSSDNGGYGPGRFADNTPLRAGKGTLYEGGVRSAACMAWEGRIKPGTVVDEPLHIADLFPTLVTLAGGKPEGRLPLDGRDAWKTIAEGAPSPHEDILCNVTPAGGAIRVGEWKLVLNGGGAGEGAADPMEKKARKKDDGAGGGVELFHLPSDPGERKNLAAEKPDKVKELRARLEAYAKAAALPKQAPKAKDFKSPKVWGEAD
jgi:arylsulfatase A-like enzyme